MIAKPLVLLMLTAAIAGCTIRDGEVKGGATTLDFNGEGSGDHEKSLDCAGSGRLTGTGDIEDGQVDITIRGEDGDVVFEETYDQSFDFDSRSVDGSNTKWTLRAVRGGDDLIGDEFRGRYSFSLTCG